MVAVVGSTYAETRLKHPAGPSGQVERMAEEQRQPLCRPIESATGSPGDVRPRVPHQHHQQSHGQERTEDATSNRWAVCVWDPYTPRATADEGPPAASGDFTGTRWVHAESRYPH